MLANLPPKLEKTLLAILVGSIITRILWNPPTTAQVTLAALVVDIKHHINEMHAYGVRCLYDEILQFMKTAARAFG